MQSTVATIFIISLIFAGGCIATSNPHVDTSLSWKTIDNADDTISGKLVLNPDHTGFVELTDISKRSTSRIEFTYAYTTGSSLHLTTKDNVQYELRFSGDMADCAVLPGRQWVRI